MDEEAKRAGISALLRLLVGRAMQLLLQEGALPGPRPDAFSVHGRGVSTRLGFLHADVKMFWTVFGATNAARY